MNRPPDPSKISDGLALAFYAAAAVTIGLTWFDYLATVWPFAPGSPGWRYGAVGIYSQFVITPLIAAAFAILLATLRGDAGARRLFSLVLVVAGGAVLVSLLGFSLDFLQSRREVTDPAQQRTLLMGAAKAALKLGISAVAGLWLGIAALRQPGGNRPAAGRSSIVVGQ